MTEKERAITQQSVTTILSKWATLAAFIRVYEPSIWEVAKDKARNLLKNKEKAAEYVNDRKSGKPSSKKTDKQFKVEYANVPEEALSESRIEELDKQAAESKKVKSKELRPKKNRRDRYSLNYKRLMKIAPNLEERLLNGEEVYGKSKVPGLMDLILEWNWTEEEGVYHIALTHYYNQNGDLVPDPDMRVLVKVEEQMVEALSFQDTYGYQEVYQDIYKRNMVNLPLRKELNKFLERWLLNLINQHHEVDWIEDETDQEPAIAEEVKEVEKVEEIEVEEIEPPKEEPKATVHFQTLAKLMRQNEGLDKEASIAKAVKLIGQGKGDKEYQRLLKKHRVQDIKNILFGNFLGLERLMPDIVKKLKRDEVDGILTNETKDSYDLVPGDPFNTTTYRFGVNKNKKNGTSIIISVNMKAKRAWLEYSDSGFLWKGQYTHEPNAIHGEESQEANRFLSDWIQRLLDEKYTVEWAETEEEKKLAPNSPQKEGEVKLTDRHIRAGFKQKHIDWINKHRKGLVLVIRRNLINNTKNFFLDSLYKAMQAGKRLSRTGVIYYEGRSNRSDIKVWL